MRNCFIPFKTEDRRPQMSAFKGQLSDQQIQDGRCTHTQFGEVRGANQQRSLAGSKTVHFEPQRWPETFCRFSRPRTGRLIRLHVHDCAGTAEAQPGHLRVGFGPVALGRTNAQAAVDPPAAAKSLLRPALRSLGIPVLRILVIVGVIPVGCPTTSAPTSIRVASTIRIAILLRSPRS